ncbi:MAG: DUF2254 domain-containing protein [Acidobacteriota bacterium]|nr:DUF2254 domain-containing protein [Acidobacteriota bacterium]
MNKLKQLWSNLRSSLWFVPVLIVVCSVGLAVGFIEVDGRINRELLAEYPRIFGAGADGSRGMLTAIAGSMITVAGLTFSLTLLAMAQASSQYTSRILRNFMGDRRNQFVLGFFVGIFAYCLIVLRTIRGGDEGRFIPSLAVFFGLLLAISSVGVLIFFIHHIASSIQASSIISSAAAETLHAIERLFPDEVGEEAGEAEAAEAEAALAGQTWQVLPVGTTGYIQDVDAEGLVRFASERNCIVRMERGLGAFVVKHSPLVSIACQGTGGGAVDEAMLEELRGIFTINHYRTIDQDPAFGLRQIVDVALKALSPGVNDTTTAIVCVDYLGAILAGLAGRRIERRYRSKAGEVQVIARGATFESLVREAFDQIRDAAAGNTSIYLRLLGAIETVAQQMANRRRGATLAAQVTLIAEEAERTLASDYNLERVRAKAAAVRAIIESKAGVE